MKHIYKKTLGFALLTCMTMPTTWAMEQNEKEFKIKELFRLISDSNYPQNEAAEAQASRGEIFFPLLEELGPFTRHKVSPETCKFLNNQASPWSKYYLTPSLIESCSNSNTTEPIREIISHGAPWLLNQTLTWLNQKGITSTGSIEGINMNELKVGDREKGSATIILSDDYSGRFSLLDYAIMALRSDMVKALLIHGADANTHNQTGYTPITTLFLEYVPRGGYNDTPSVIKNDQDILDALCRLGKVKNLPIYGLHPTTTLLRTPPQLLELLLNCPTIDPNHLTVKVSINGVGEISSKELPLPELHVLLKAAAIPPQHQTTSLSKFIAPYAIKNLPIRLEHPRVDVNIKDPEGYTILARAVAMYPSLIKIILDATNKRPQEASPIDVNASVPKSSYLPEGGSILDLATAVLLDNRRENLLRANDIKPLIEMGAQNLHMSKIGLSPKLIIELATLLPIMSSYGIANALSSSINEPYNSEGDTPLIALLKNTKYLSLVKELIEYPTVDVNVTNSNGETALDIAYWRMEKSTNPANWEQVLIWLEKRGAHTGSQLRREK